MTRTDFQELAELRLKEAEALLAAGLWDGAYYLAGYAVECGLKGCIAKLTVAEEFPDKDRANNSFTHDLVKLRKVAGLEDAYDTDAPPGSKLRAYWDVVKDWKESTRYKLRRLELEAKQLCEAIADPSNGVLSWIKRYW